jgi:hypothetical protein
MINADVDIVSPVSHQVRHTGGIGPFQGVCFNSAREPLKWPFSL